MCLAQPQAPDVLRVALDADWSAQVGTEFADDPEMFQAIFEVQQEKTQAHARALAKL